MISYAGISNVDILLLLKGLQPKNNKDRGDTNDPRVRLKRDCVGIMAAFRLKKCSEHLVIVANTHIFR